MATSFDTINDIFYNLIEEDGTFFNYYGLSSYDAQVLAQQRADACLMEAATKLALEIDADIDFADFDSVSREFAADFTKPEMMLMASLQHEEYLLRDIAKLRANAVRFTSAEQAVFSPANERKTFFAMFDMVHKRNMELIDRYIARDRLTGAYKELEYDISE